MNAMNGFEYNNVIVSLSLKNPANNTVDGIANF